MKNIYRVKRIMMCIIIISLFSFILISNAQAGKIVLANDEWTLSNTGFSGLNDGAAFAENIASWFDGGSPGNFLVYSSNLGLSGPTASSLSDTMASTGNTWTVSTAIPFNLPALLAYDAIFLAGNGCKQCCSDRLCKCRR